MKKSKKTLIVYFDIGNNNNNKYLTVCEENIKKRFESVKNKYDFVYVPVRNGSTYVEVID